MFFGGGSGAHQFVKVGSYSILGGLSVVTKDVPEGALAIGREKQKNIDGWVKRKRSRK